MEGRHLVFRGIAGLDEAGGGQVEEAVGAAQRVGERQALDAEGVSRPIVEVLVPLGVDECRSGDFRHPASALRLPKCQP